MTAALSQRQLAFVTRHSGFPWQRQTDDGAGGHCGLDIRFAPDPGDDWIVVFDDIAAPFQTRVPLNRRIIFVTEPPEFKRYPPNFINQFGVLVSPYAIRGYRGRWVQSHPAIGWYYGLAFAPEGGVTSRIGLMDLRRMPVPVGKVNRISVVCSTKSKLPRHRQRVRLIKHLMQAFPNSFDVFGNGFQSIRDKADAIAPYRYHLVLENNDCPHFWTEKLADAYLGYSLPVFSGCRNVTDYFPERSIVPLLDIGDLDAAVAAIGNLLERDPWAERVDAIRAARTELIERHNLFSIIARLTDAPVEARSPLSRKQDHIRPARNFRGIIDGVIGAIRRRRLRRSA